MKAKLNFGKREKGKPDLSFTKRKMETQDLIKFIK